MVKKRSKPLVYALVGVVMATLVALAIPMAAQALPPIAYTLKVTTKSGAPLSGYSVSVFNPRNGDQVGPPSGLATASGVPGEWNVTGSPYVAYTLLFTQTKSVSGEPYSEYLGGTTSLNHAQTYVPTDGETLSLTLDTTSVITGKVTSPTGHPVSGEAVTPYRYDGADWVTTGLPTTTTSSSGKYSFSESLPGSYILKFSDHTTAGYLDRYSGNAPYFNNGDAFYVSPTSTATENVKLEQGGRIKGSVLIDTVSIPNHKPLPSDQVRAWAYPLNGAPGSFTLDTADAVEGTESDSHGDFTIGGLDPTGFEHYYAVELVPAASLGISAEFIGGGATWVQNDNYYLVPGGATTSLPQTTITSTATASLDFTISASGIVPSGTLVNLTRVDDPDFSESQTVTNDADSTSVSFTGLAPGNYDAEVVSAPNDLAWAPASVGFQLSAGANARGTSLSAYTPLAFTGTQAITETSTAIGTEYHAVASDNAAVDPTYQWLRNGAPIYGANTVAYQSGSADFGTHLSVRVRAYVPYETPVTVVEDVGGSTGSVETVGAELVNTLAPTITSSASALPGAVLHANPGTWNVADANYTYAWTSTRPDAPPFVGTGSTYVVQPSDAGAEIGLIVSADAPHFDTGGTAFSSAEIPVNSLPAPTVKVAPKITAKTTLSNGDTQYTYKHGTWSSGAVTYIDEWLIDGTQTALSDTSSTFTVPEADANTRVQLEERVTADGYTDSDWSYVEVKDSTEAPVLTGSPEVYTTSSTPIPDAATPVYAGQALTVNYSSWDVEWADGDTSAVGTFKTQWYQQKGSAKSTAVVGATSTDFTPTTGEYQDRLTVVVTITHGGYAAYSVTLPAGTVGLDKELVNDPPIATMHGTGQETTKLSVTLTAWPVSSVTTTYQWYACTSNSALSCSTIAGATKSSFTPTTSSVPVNDYVDVLVSGSKVGYEGAKVAPALLQITTPSSPRAVTAATYAGGITKATVGVKISTHSATYDLSNVHTSWLWQSCDTSCTNDANWNTVQGSDSTSSSYTPVAEDWIDGQTVELRALEVASSPATPETTVLDLGSLVLHQATLKMTSAPKLTTTSTTYKVTGGSWSPAVTTTVSWFVGDSAEGESFNSATLAKSVAFDGEPVYAVVHAVLNGYVDPAVVVVAQKGAAPTDPSAAIHGNTYGFYLQADDSPVFPSVSVPVTSSESYEWLYLKPGATQPSAVPGESGPAKFEFVPAASYIEDLMDVKITVTSNLFATATFEPSFVQENPAPAATTSGVASITASGDFPAPGHILTAVPPTYSPAVTKFDYLWQWEESPTEWISIPGATGSTYKLPSESNYSTIRVEVTTDVTGHLTSTTDSPGLEVESLGVLTPLTQPSVSGSGRVGGVLTVSPGTWNYPGASFEYQWQRNGTDILGARSSTFTPPADSLGDVISVDVEAYEINYDGADVTTPGVTVAAGAAPTVVTAPKLTVTTASPRVASVTAGAWSLGGLTLSYAWSVGGVSVPGDADTITLTDGASGVVSVTITASRDGYADQTVTETKTITALQ